MTTGNWQLETGNYPRQSHCTLHVLCGRKKLPFAGYSIVKELTLKLPAISLQLPAS